MIFGLRTCKPEGAAGVKAGKLYVVQDQIGEEMRLASQDSRVDCLTQVVMLGLEK